MVKKASRLIGDCSHLSFSRAKGEQLRGMAIATGVRETEWHPWSVHAALPKIIDSDLPGGDDDASDGGRLRLRTLKGFPVLQWPIVLPERDPRGIFSADDFECWKKASASRIGIAGYHYSFKAGGPVACHSSLEARLLAYFEMCPFVVEIRTQYPQWNREAFIAYCNAGEPFPRRELATIDFMLTLQIPGVQHRIYHGVSAKPDAHVGLKSVKGRHNREVAGLWEWGSTHEVMTETTVTDVEYESYRRMFEHMKYVETEEIAVLAAGAHEFSTALLSTQARGDAARVVSMVGKRFGWDRKKSFRLLAIALFLGYLRWDVEHLYATNHPLCFIRP
ncbi:PDDEXK family nuclease [Burkholderia arboris]|uniref:hypothetical protein n=1 Tax=Burkholderia arboris TaxID=488730 RepID=UPI001CF19E37|nr:hypothetical protein [Burkholderia arboris]MCA8494025.1 hypothetical protein [Burkholderia arboris]